jgi:hypothetical protein
VVESGFALSTGAVGLDASARASELVEADAPAAIKPRQRPKNERLSVGGMRFLLGQIIDPQNSNGEKIECQ